MGGFRNLIGVLKKGILLLGGLCLGPLFRNLPNVGKKRRASDSLRCPTACKLKALWAKWRDHLLWLLWTHALGLYPSTFDLEEIVSCWKKP